MAMNVVVGKIGLLLWLALSDPEPFFSQNFQSEHTKTKFIYMTTFGQSELVTLPVTRIFRLPLSKGVFGKQLEGLILGNGMG